MIANDFFTRYEAIKARAGYSSAGEPSTGQADQWWLIRQVEGLLFALATDGSSGLASDSARPKLQMQPTTNHIPQEVRQ